LNHDHSIQETHVKILRKNWIVVFGIAFGFYAGLPFLTPVFMHIGWNNAGNAIYFIYSFLCHQLAQRSFFLFGPKFTYSLAEIGATGLNTSNFLALRHFIGNAAMGWKVAWSDRMVSMFTSLWIFGLVWWPLRKRLPKIPFWGLLLFLIPMAVDGGTHFLSDLAGIGLGFRDTNLWLATLTQHVLSPGFYAGEAWGSFNSVVRLLTGILFGLGVAWFTFPFLDEAFSEAEASIQTH
jgi:uncharacterized membrane protein